MAPRENKNNAYVKFGGTNKGYYGIFRSGLFNSKQHMSLRKPNLHYVPREISQSERILHCRNLFLVGNEKWCTVELYQISHSQ